jgi:hypothetical protein
MKIVATLLASVFISGLAFSQTLKFDFGPGAVKKGYTQILPETSYSKEKGYGFLPGATLTGAIHGQDALKNDFITSNQPFYFTVDLPEGD